MFRRARGYVEAAIGLAVLMSSILPVPGRIATVIGAPSETPQKAAPVLGSNEKIAFDDDWFHVGDIYVATVGGTRVRNLTKSPHRKDAGPVWSPDGQKIAFTSCCERSSSVDIFVMDVDGTTLTQITNSEDDDWDGMGSWSPDGTRIAFSRANLRERSRTGIWVMNADGSNPVQLTRGPAHGSPKWSPDGQKIAFNDSGGQVDIYVMNADGSDPVNITNDPGYDYVGSWAPDSSKIVFYSSRQADDYELYVMNPDGTGLQKLTDNNVDDWSPDWSPDGSKVVFQHNFRELWMMNPDGTDQRHILSWSEPTFNPDWQPIPTAATRMGTGARNAG